MSMPPVRDDDQLRQHDHTDDRHLQQQVSSGFVPPQKMEPRVIVGHHQQGQEDVEGRTAASASRGNCPPREVSLLVVVGPPAVLWCW